MRENASCRHGVCGKSLSLLLNVALNQKLLLDNSLLKGEGKRGSVQGRLRGRATGLAVSTVPALGRTCVWFIRHCCPLEIPKF